MSSNTISLEVTPRDPIICRDGRPFSSGDRVKSLDWIYPSVFAGSLRTLLGKQLNLEFDANDIKALKALAIRGPLPCVNGEIFLPKPLDCVIRENDDNKTYTAFAARPMALRDGEGTDLPAGLKPVLLPDTAKEDFKPAKTNPFWSMEKMVEWLAKTTVTDDVYDKTDKDEPGTLAAPQNDERTHVAIQADMGSAKDSMLFSTTGLDMTANKHGNAISLVADISQTERFTDTLSKLNLLHPLGGERRLAQWKTRSDSLPNVPEKLKQLSSKTQVRMVLATPAIFGGGWRPSWLDEKPLQGTVPGSTVKVKLVGASVDRWKPISGWSYEKETLGPKPSRRLVPAGSVYFFEIIDGDFGSVLDSCWMRSVCDEEQDRNDGFGLTIWGVW